LEGRGGSRGRGKRRRKREEGKLGEGERKREGGKSGKGCRNDRTLALKSERLHGKFMEGVVEPGAGIFQEEDPLLGETI
jgi:hypothetical protein